MLAATLIALALQGAQKRVVTLTKPEQVLQQDFSQIRGVRELTDGRVLISDRLDKGVVVADFAMHTVRQIGRTGRGPAEYRLPTVLRAIPGDSTLLIDEGNSRTAIIGPDLRIHRSFTLTLPGLTIPTGPRAIDRQGRLYVQIPGWINQSAPNDSLAVVRFDQRSNSVDTVLRVKGVTYLPPGPRYGFGHVVFGPQDGWVLAPDGRIAIARSGDYHIEWYEPNGRVVRGAPVPFERLPVTMTERMAYVKAFLENSNVGGRGSDDALSAVPAEWLEEANVRRMAERNTFAEVQPPFTETLPLVDPDGAVWVERSTKLGDPALWDVFDGTGKRLASVRLPPNRRLAAFGARWIYLIATDSDGLQHLERYDRSLTTPQGIERKR
jgi:hypothetical protein